MKRILSIAVMLLVGSFSQAQAAAVVGKAAPAFELKDVDGKTVQLQSYRGKYVVLEWTNFQCPFVGKHYGSGNMQALQKKYTEKGVVWLSICSSAPGKQGYMTGTEAKELIGQREASPTRFLLDPNGKVGHAYGAKTTPHMFVINEKGLLVYRGALDNAPFGQTDKNEAKTNYVEAALADLSAGHTVTKAESTPYG